MRWTCVSTFVTLAVCAGVANAQVPTPMPEPVGPVRPNPPEATGTVELYLKQFEQALKEKRPDAVWKVLDKSGKETILKMIEELTGETSRVTMMPVGPIIPKTPPPKPVTGPAHPPTMPVGPVIPKTPPPKPVAGPAHPPTKEDLDSELNELRESLKKANEKDPNLKLSPEADRQMKDLLERLAKGKVT